MAVPRYARIVLPDHPHHVVQRGHNRQVIFATTRDFEVYLEELAEWKEKLRVLVNSYCLMSNHVHHVVNPGSDPTSLGKLMKAVATRHTRYLNSLHGRTGTAWEGRYKSSPIETDCYLLACTRYVELNPRRANICARPEDYLWSSYRAKIGLARCDWLDLDGLYLAMGRSPQERQVAYRAWVNAAVDELESALLRKAIQRGHMTASDLFVARIEEQVSRRVSPRRVGRPLKWLPSVAVPET